MKEIIWFAIGIMVLTVVAGLLQPTKKKKRRRSKTSRSKAKKPASNSFNRASPTCRPDEVILTLPLDKRREPNSSVCWLCTSGIKAIPSKRLGLGVRMEALTWSLRINAERKRLSRPNVMLTITR